MHAISNDMYYYIYNIHQKIQTQLVATPVFLFVFLLAIYLVRKFIFGQRITKNNRNYFENGSTADTST